MKIVKRLLPYARPLYHFLPEYVIYTTLGIGFGLLNFTLLIPVLQLLFDQQPPVLTHQPAFTFSLSYLKDLFNYWFSATIHEQGKFSALVGVCVIIASSILLANLFRYLAVRVLLRLRLKVMEGLRNHLYQKYLEQSLSFHYNHPKGELLMVMLTEVQEIESSIINTLQILLRDPFIVLAYFLILFYWSPTLTTFTLLFLPVTGITISLLTKKLKKMNYFSQEMQGKLMTFTDETLSGIKQVQSYVAGTFLFQTFRDINHELSRHSKRLFGKKELASPISEVLGVIAAVVLVIFGGYLILHQQTALTGPTFIGFLALYTQIIPPLKNLSQTSSTLQRGLVACEKIFFYLDQPIAIASKTQGKPKKTFTTSIELKGVSFSYSQRRVLHSIDLRIEKGQTIALVGQSGSGKSTLVDLIARFYDVQEGGIWIDGENIKDLELRDLRQLIGLVSQETFLFNDTIAHNIALGHPNASLDSIRQAARVANADDFIQQLDKGYETKTGERGVKLSGGQRQRISIARAVIKDAPILILDEATSSLDTESEKLVQDALSRLLSNRTCIIIAHRLSTVRHAHEIIVLHEGEIKERGTHEALLRMNGYYKKLVDLQEIQ